MPFLNLKIAAPDLAPGQVRKLHADLTEQMGRILGKKTELTAVFIEHVPLTGWAIGAADVPLAAHLDVNVTAGTNDELQKARFLAEAHDLLKMTLGEGLPLATYVVIREVPANAWGYSGLSQEQRQKALLKPSRPASNLKANDAAPSGA